MSSSDATFRRPTQRKNLHKIQSIDCFATVRSLRFSRGISLDGTHCCASEFFACRNAPAHIVDSLNDSRRWRKLCAMHAKTPYEQLNICGECESMSGQCFAHSDIANSVIYLPYYCFIINNSNNAFGPMCASSSSWCFVDFRVTCQCNASHARRQIQFV